MNVASLELCKELYEVSGWEAGNTWAAYSSYDGSEQRIIVDSNAGELGHDLYRVTYAYDLGYLLRKLPKEVINQNVKRVLTLQANSLDDIKYASYDKYDNPANNLYENGADSYEDAACKLAIQLFKERILTNGR